MFKLIALVAMVLDHSAIFFFPEYTFILRSIGSVSFPLFSWGIVQGLEHTKDLNRYLINLVLCCLITQPFYSYLFPDYTRLNDLFTLLAGLSLIVLSKKLGPRAYYLILPLVIVNVVTIYILLPVLIYVLHKKPFYLSWASFIFFFVMTYLSGQLYIMFGLTYLFFVYTPLPRLAVPKYFFYAFYPGHFMIIIFIKSFSGGL